MSHRPIVLSFLLWALACSKPEKPWAVAKADQATLRTTTSGQVVGGEGRYDNHAWLGIPFAAPPVGELRWRAPQATASWGGQREALTFGSPCVQFASPLGGIQAEAGTLGGSEDCLYLNVYAPKFAAEQVPKEGARLPVMLWIHGGGNSIGTASFYEGGKLAKEGNVIIVTTQYRVGPFGWFHHAALADGATPEEVSGNFGTLDLIQALRWVHENIASFGGDPGNVTIFGESAGGMNVYSLLMAPAAKGLFHRAIAQSGGLSETTVADAEHFVDDAVPGHRNSSNEVILRVLAEKERPVAKAKLVAMPNSEIASMLRAKTAEQIMDGYDTPRKSGLMQMPLVFRDGTVLPADDWTSHFSDASKWNEVPVLLGTNRDEQKLFMVLDQRLVWRLFGSIPKVIDEPSYMAMAEYLSRSWKASAADKPATVMRKAGHAGVYVYRFDWHGEPTVFGSDLGKLVGAAHSLEIPFVFGHFQLGRLGSILFEEKSAADRAVLSKSMMSYWTEFAATGNPGQGRGKDQIAWTAWDDTTPESPRFLLLDSPSEGGIHFASQPETVERIIADVDDDSRLPTALQKCRVFHELAGWTHGIPKSAYLKPGKTSCAAFPFDAFPWDGSEKH